MSENLIQNCQSISFCNANTVRKLRSLKKLKYAACLKPLASTSAPNSVSQIVTFWQPSIVKWLPKQKFWSPEKKKGKKERETKKKRHKKKTRPLIYEGLVFRTVRLLSCRLSINGHRNIVERERRDRRQVAETLLLLLQKCSNRVIMFNTILVYTRSINGNLSSRNQFDLITAYKVVILIYVYVHNHMRSRTNKHCI